MTTNEILDRTARALGGVTVFGEPQTSDGVTVIPAAVVRGGGGGGGGTQRVAGTDADGETAVGEGEGGGFGLSARPAGALIIDGHEVRWKMPLDLTRIIIGGQLVVVAYFFFTWLTERARARANS